MQFTVQAWALTEFTTCELANLRVGHVLLTTGGSRGPRFVNHKWATWLSARRATLLLTTGGALCSPSGGPRFDNHRWLPPVLLLLGSCSFLATMMGPSPSLSSCVGAAHVRRLTK